MIVMYIPARNMIFVLFFVSLCHTYVNGQSNDTAAPGGLEHGHSHGGSRIPDLNSLINPPSEPSGSPTNLVSDTRSDGLSTEVRPEGRVPDLNTLLGTSGSSGRDTGGFVRGEVRAAGGAATGRVRPGVGGARPLDLVGPMAGGSMGRDARRMSGVGLGPIDRMPRGPMPGAGGPMPGAGGLIPGAGGSVPGTGRLMPGTRRLMPGAGGPMPSAGRLMRGAGGSVPGAGGLMPGVGGSMPGAGGSMPGAGGLMRGAGGLMRGAGGPMPGAGGLMPGAGGPMPGAGGLMPGAGGLISGAGGSMPGAGGPMPGTGRLMRSDGRLMPGASGLMPSSGGPMRDTRGPMPGAGIGPSPTIRTDRGDLRSMTSDRGLTGMTLDGGMRPGLIGGRLPVDGGARTMGLGGSSMAEGGRLFLDESGRLISRPDLLGSRSMEMLGGRRISSADLAGRGLTSSAGLRLGTPPYPLSSASFAPSSRIGPMDRGLGPVIGPGVLESGMGSLAGRIDPGTGAIVADRRVGMAGPTVFRGFVPGSGFVPSGPAGFDAIRAPGGLGGAALLPPGTGPTLLPAGSGGSPLDGRIARGGDAISMSGSPPTGSTLPAGMEMGGANDSSTGAAAGGIRGSGAGAGIIGVPGIRPGIDMRGSGVGLAGRGAGVLADGRGLPARVISYDPRSVTYPVYPSPYLPGTSIYPSSGGVLSTYRPGLPPYFGYSGYPGYAYYPSFYPMRGF